MPNYNDETAVLIPLNKTDTEIARSAYECLTNTGADELASLLVEGYEPTSAMEKIVIEALSTHEEDAIADKTWTFDVETCQDGLVLSTENHEYAMPVFISAVLHGLGSSDVITYGIAGTCSRSLADAFGGYGYAVTADNISSHGLLDFFDAESTAARGQLRYYFCHFEYTRGERTEGDRFLCQAPVSFDEGMIREHLINDFSSERREDEDGNLWMDFETILSSDEVRRITPYEFKVMANYLPVIVPEALAPVTVAEAEAEAEAA